MSLHMKDNTIDNILKQICQKMLTVGKSHSLFLCRGVRKWDSFLITSSLIPLSGN